jgi:hypothetical protein
MTTTASKIPILQLDWKDRDGDVTVTPHDESRFVVKVHQAIEACRATKQAEQFEAQLKLLLEEIGKWLQVQERIDSAYLTLREGNFLFLVIRRDPGYERDFEDGLSDLDLKLAEDSSLDLIRVDTLALPHTSEESLRSFLDPRFALKYPDGPRG